MLFKSDILDRPLICFDDLLEVQPSLRPVLHHFFSGRIVIPVENTTIWIVPVPIITLKGTPMDESKVRRAMRRVLEHSKLPLHFSPHCLRHTYASLMLQQGESLTYVQRQLGHASINLTADTYGKWLPLGNKAAVDRLDAPSFVESGSKVVANEGVPVEGNSEVVGKFGGPCRGRTYGPLIKSPAETPPQDTQQEQSQANGEDS